ncbi:hypothetical protein A2U01_0111914, partial [Trifolium medium]|nr:hypothetical protein [Trifolium medium]
EHQRDSSATGSQNHCFGGKPLITLSVEVQNSSSTPKSSQQASRPRTASAADQETRPHSSPRG